MGLWPNVLSSLCGTGLVSDEPSKCMKLLLVGVGGAFSLLFIHLSTVGSQRNLRTCQGGVRFRV